MQDIAFWIYKNDCAVVTRSEPKAIRKALWGGAQNGTAATAAASTSSVACVSACVFSFENTLGIYKMILLRNVWKSIINKYETTFESLLDVTS